MKAIMQACMSKPELKEHGQDISKIIPSLLKDMSKVPDIVLDQNTEMKSLDDAKKSIEEELKCSVEIVAAEKSKEAKAKHAYPGKPAIVIE